MCAALNDGTASRRAGHDSGQLDPVLFAGRLGGVRALREHHVWQAAKSFWPDGSVDARADSRRRFARLMDADALVDAVLTLVAAAVPTRKIEAVTQDAGLWTCRMRIGSASSAVSVTHPDLAAAMLAAFLLTLAEDGPSNEAEPADQRPHRDA
jgi:hypothetical protein